MLQRPSNAQLVLSAQLDSLAALLKETCVRIETLKIATKEAEIAVTQARKVAEQDQRRFEPPDPDRIVSIPEAARLSSLSTYTLRRQHRNKWIQLSEKRFGMRLRDVLMLADTKEAAV